MGGRGVPKWDTKWIGLDLMGRWGVRFGLDCLVVVESSGVLWVDGRGGMSSLCHDVGLGYGVCSLVGVSYVIRWVFDSEWGSCRGGVLLMYK